MKRFTTLLLVILLTLAAAACQRGKASGEVRQAGAGEKTISSTHWTERTELFVEHPPLVATRKARFAVHFTDLESFKPVAAGVAVVELASSAGQPQTFTSAAPSRPGIFGVDVIPTAPGSYTMTIRLRGQGLDDPHEVGTVRVYADERAAAEEPEPEAVEAVKFLKEQQWSMDFATAKVAERAMRSSIEVTGDVRPRAGGEVLIGAPIAGRLLFPEFAPAVGSVVEKGQMLARIAPRSPAPLERASLRSLVDQAKAELDLARQDRDRAERLLAARAIAAKRVEEAKTAEAIAEAKLRAAQENLAQHENSRDAAGTASSDSAFAVRAPIGGVLAESKVTPGAYIEEGASLFRVVSTDVVNIRANVPESALGTLTHIAGAEITLPGSQAVIRPARLLSRAPVLDSASRTVSALYEVPNAHGTLAVGQAVTVRLLTGQGNPGPAVASGAIVDDAGRSVVFVQIAGESFVRHPLKLGAREGDFVQVLEGVKAGDRVVTRGAYLIRLAALSTQIPAHGHVH